MISQFDLPKKLNNCDLIQIIMDDEGKTVEIVVMYPSNGPTESFVFREILFFSFSKMLDSDGYFFIGEFNLYQIKGDEKNEVLARLGYKIGLNEKPDIDLIHLHLDGGIVLDIISKNFEIKSKEYT